MQGVGFRATVREAARRHEVSGWVRNEPDGSVRMEAQGAPDEIDRLRQAVRSAMRGFIADEREARLPILDSEAGFEVRR